MLWLSSPATIKGTICSAKFTTSLRAISQEGEGDDKGPLEDKVWEAAGVVGYHVSVLVVLGWDSGSLPLLRSSWTLCWSSYLFGCKCTERRRTAKVDRAVRIGTSHSWWFSSLDNVAPPFSCRILQHWRWVESWVIVGIEGKLRGKYLGSGWWSGIGDVDILEVLGCHRRGHVIMSGMIARLLLLLLLLTNSAKSITKQTSWRWWRRRGCRRKHTSNDGMDLRPQSRHRPCINEITSILDRTTISIIIIDRRWLMFRVIVMSLMMCFRWWWWWH